MIQLGIYARNVVVTARICSLSARSQGKELESMKVVESG